MFAAIARSLFDAYKRQGATVRVVWHPSSGEPVCEGDAVRSQVEVATDFSGTPVRVDQLEVIKAEFPGIGAGECVTVGAHELVVRSILSDDGLLLRLAIGLPDQARSA